MIEVSLGHAVYRVLYNLSFSLQTSRIGRLAAFAGTDSSQPHSETSGNGSQDPIPSQPLAEIVYTRLVMSGRRGRGRGRGEGGGEGVDGGLRQISQNGIKNFKTFLKVHTYLELPLYIVQQQKRRQFAVHVTTPPNHTSLILN